jgi:hypothetical protein
MHLSNLLPHLLRIPLRLLLLLLLLLLVLQ